MPWPTAIAADRAAGLRPIAIVATDRHDVLDRDRSRRGRSRTSPSARACGCTSTRPTPGPVALLPDRRAPFDGWERADSIVINPHKWLFTPLDASLLLTRRMSVLRDAFSLVPEYLRTLDRETPVHDYNEYTPQLGRRFRALKLWIQLRWFGLDGLRRRIERHLEMAQTFARLGRRRSRLGAARAGPVLDGLLPLEPGRRGDPTPSWTSATRAIMDAVNRTGEVFLSHTRLDGRFTIRVAIGNLRTEPRHVERAWALLRDGGPERMSPTPTPRDVQYFASTDELRDWFDANHETADRAVARATTARPPASRPCPGRRPSTRRCASAGSTACATRSTTSAAPSASRPGARAATGARSTWPRSPRSPSRDGCARPGSPPSRRARRSGPAIYSYERDAGAFSRRRDRPVPGRCGRLGRLGATPAVVSQDRDLLGDQRQAPRDPRAATRAAHRRLCRRPQAERPDPAGRAMRAAIQAALDEAIAAAPRARPGRRVRPAGGARSLVDAGLHALCVPSDVGGLGATMAEAAEVLLALGAVDGSTALGFAMQVHVTGALRDGDAGSGRARGDLPPDRRGRGVGEQRRDGGRWRVAGPRRHPGHHGRAQVRTIHGA